MSFLDFFPTGGWGGDGSPEEEEGQDGWVGDSSNLENFKFLFEEATPII